MCGFAIFFFATSIGTCITFNDSWTNIYLDDEVSIDDAEPDDVAPTRAPAVWDEIDDDDPWSAECEKSVLWPDKPDKADNERFELSTPDDDGADKPIGCATDKGIGCGIDNPPAWALYLMK